MLENYKMACVEILEIIKYLPKNEKEKIPYEYIKFFEENSKKDYNFKFEISKPLENQKILKETYSIMLILYMKYFSNEKQNAQIKKLLWINEQQREKEKKEKYNINEIFEKRNKEIQNFENKTTELIVIEEQNILKKILKKIINLIRNKH